MSCTTSPITKAADLCKRPAGGEYNVQAKSKATTSRSTDLQRNEPLRVIECQTRDIAFHLDSEEPCCSRVSCVGLCTRETFAFYARAHQRPQRRPRLDLTFFRSSTFRFLTFSRLKRPLDNRTVSTLWVDKFTRHGGRSAATASLARSSRTSTSYTGPGLLEDLQESTSSPLTAQCCCYVHSCPGSQPYWNFRGHFCCNKRRKSADIQHQDAQIGQDYK